MIDPIDFELSTPHPQVRVRRGTGDEPSTVLRSKVMRMSRFSMDLNVRSFCLKYKRNNFNLKRSKRSWELNTLTHRPSYTGRNLATTEL